jgi:hypothetical protein
MERISEVVEDRLRFEKKINSRKARKFSREFGQLLNAFVKPFALKKHQDASA